MIADVSQSDVFIDCPLPDYNTALVVAQAHPLTAPSLYKTSVIGQCAFVKNEPAVLFSLLSGEPVLGSRGISQEGTDMQQNVIPIHSPGGKLIGVLIMEQDISQKIEQEKNVERLMETTEQLSETLLHVAMSEENVQSFMHEGIILFDNLLTVTYTNARAHELLQAIGHQGPFQNQSIVKLLHGKLTPDYLIDRRGFICEELVVGSVSLELKAVALEHNFQVLGGFILVRDLSDLKEKEKQLLVKSVVIREIHHRVKNNLQTVSSLLHLQMRRTGSEEVKKVFRDSIHRINSIAVIHEMLAYEGLEIIQFKDVVERISKNIISSIAKPEQRIRVDIKGDAFELHSDQATTLALVVNELIQNSVVHGFGDKSEGIVTIHLKQNNELVSIVLEDNGIGIGSANSFDRKNHLGLHIVNMLIQENLEGQLDLVDTGGGTKAHITFQMKGAVAYDAQFDFDRG
jgi:two-component sensor histidine kinase